MSSSSESSVKVVRPKNCTGYNMSFAQLWGSGPKWTITCGECEATFQKRIPMVTEPGIPCPHCGAVNKLPITVTQGGET
jgi:rRNA maturation endonuclease Nob1